MKRNWKISKRANSKDLEPKNMIFQIKISLDGVSSTLHSGEQKIN